MSETRLTLDVAQAQSFSMAYSGIRLDLIADDDEGYRTGREVTVTLFGASIEGWIEGVWIRPSRDIGFHGRPAGPFDVTLDIRRRPSTEV